MLANSLNTNAILHDTNDELNLIVAVLSLYNCRISEILSAKKSDIIKNKFVILHGAKGSADIVIRDKATVAAFVALSLNRKSNLFLYSNYSKVYTFIKKNFSHLICQVITKKNNKVTHVFRYINIEDLQDEKSIKSFLHHNSVRSNSFYTNKIRGKKNGNN